MIHLTESTTRFMAIRFQQDDTKTNVVQDSKDAAVDNKCASYRMVHQRTNILRYYCAADQQITCAFPYLGDAFPTQDVLIEPDKRAEYDAKRKRQQDALSRSITCSVLRIHVLPTKKIVLRSVCEHVEAI